MMRRRLLLISIVVLAAAWIGPLPRLAAGSFSAHMILHLILITIAAPLMALGLRDSSTETTLYRVGLLNPILAAVLELVIVWGWHSPVLHEASRATTRIFALEQLSFLAAGVLFWLSVLGRCGDDRRQAGIGVVALLVTSMHMTLLGTLLSLGRHSFYPHHHGASGTDALVDQQIGGLLMLAAGGTVYLLAGLALLARLLVDRNSQSDMWSDEGHRKLRP